MERNKDGAASVSGPLQRELARSMVPAGKDKVMIRLAFLPVYDPKLGEERDEWIAEARWFPAHLKRNPTGGGRQTSHSSKVAVSKPTAEEALEAITRLLVSQWPAVEAALTGDTVASS